jgi:transcriptional regulator GlxA family with amidase domain
MFGTNEFTLKENFRNILKTSIYQFYNDERLKKAYFLIQQTAIPLKEISFLCGFNDYTNFFKAFKKKYHYTPSDLNRKNNEE